MTEQEIRPFIENLEVDAKIDDETFFWLFRELSGSGDVSRLVMTKLIDFFVFGASNTIIVFSAAGIEAVRLRCDD